jgi:hypothetical protein
MIENGDGVGMSNCGFCQDNQIPNATQDTLAQSLIFCVMLCRSLFVILTFFLLVIAMSVRLRFMASDCPKSTQYESNETK